MVPSLLLTDALNTAPWVPEIVEFVTRTLPPGAVPLGPNDSLLAEIVEPEISSDVAAAPPMRKMSGPLRDAPLISMWAPGVTRLTTHGPVKVPEPPDTVRSPDTWRVKLGLVVDALVHAAANAAAVWVAAFAGADANVATAVLTTTTARPNLLIWLTPNSSPIPAWPLRSNKVPDDEWTVTPTSP
jgi:hypothetical protein